MRTLREFLQILFDPRGRVSRAGWWQALLVFAGLFLMAALVMGGVGLLRGAHTQKLEVGSWAFVLMIPTAIKRLHDRDKSAGWLLVFLAVPAVIAFADDTQVGIWPTGLSVLSAVLSLWGVVELGFLKGNRGPNVYGADPSNAARSSRST